MFGRHKGKYSALKTEFVMEAMKITLKVRLTSEC